MDRTLLIVDAVFFQSLLKLVTKTWVHAVSQTGDHFITVPNHIVRTEKYIGNAVSHAQEVVETFLKRTKHVLLATVNKVVFVQMALLQKAIDVLKRKNANASVVVGVILTIRHTTINIFHSKETVHIC